MEGYGLTETSPAATFLHFFLGPRSVDPEVYPNLERYYADLIAIYRAELRDLVELGCTAPPARRHGAALQLQ
jgi:5-methyltetrahydropteroyltriglutamate--homocysteine methyltransferase